MVNIFTVSQTNFIKNQKLKKKRNFRRSCALISNYLFGQSINSIPLLIIRTRTATTCTIIDYTTLTRCRGNHAVHWYRRRVVDVNRCRATDVSRPATNKRKHRHNRRHQNHKELHIFPFGKKPEKSVSNTSSIIP